MTRLRMKSYHGKMNLRLPSRDSEPRRKPRAARNRGQESRPLSQPCLLRCKAVEVCNSTRLPVQLCHHSRIQVVEGTADGQTRRQTAQGKYPKISRRPDRSLIQALAG